MAEPTDNIVPKALRTWFVIHFGADILWAAPLMVMPRELLGSLGWQAVDPITARMVAAALFGIGIESLLMRNKGPDSFMPMLTLKVIWSACACLGIVWTMIEAGDDAPQLAWVTLAIFAGFNVVWTYWRVTLAKLVANA